MTISISNSAEQQISYQYYNSEGHVQLTENTTGILRIFTITGQLLLQTDFVEHHSFDVAYEGLIIIHVAAEQAVYTQKVLWRWTKANNKALP